MMQETRLGVLRTVDRNHNITQQGNINNRRQNTNERNTHVSPLQEHMPSSNNLSNKRDEIEQVVVQVPEGVFAGNEQDQGIRNPSNGQGIVNEFNQNQASQRSEEITAENANCLKAFCRSPIATIKSMKTRSKIILGFITVFILAAIVVAIVIPIVFGPGRTSERLSMVTMNNVDLQIGTISGSTQEERHNYEVNSVQKKVQSLHPNTQSILKMLQNPNSQNSGLFLYEMNVPIFSIFENLNNKHKQQETCQNWLQIYNSNPRGVLNKLIAMIKEKLSTPNTYKFGKKVPDNLTVISLTGETSIEIDYDPFENKFKAATFLEKDLQTSDPQKTQQNLNRQNDQNKADGHKSDKKQEKQVNQQDSTPKRTPQQKMAQAMLQTIYYIKRVAARNIGFIRQKTQQIVNFQKNFASDNNLQQQWQVALINDCRTVSPLKFRCTIQAAQKLIPQLTVEQIQSPDAKFIITESLNIVFQQVDVTTQ